MGFIGIYWVRFTLWETHVAVENDPVEIVDLATKMMVIFHSYVNVYNKLKVYRGFLAIHLEYVSKIHQEYSWNTK